MCMCTVEYSLSLPFIELGHMYTYSCPHSHINVHTLSLSLAGQGVCCEGSCICRQDDDGFFYRHTDSSDPEKVDCACPPEEQVCREEPMVSDQIVAAIILNIFPIDDLYLLLLSVCLVGNGRHRSVLCVVQN